MTEELNETNQDGVERRDFLKSAGVTGIGAIGINPDELTFEQTLGSSLFLEAGLTYEVRSSAAEGNYAHANIDELVRHTVDTANDRVFLRQSVPETAVETFRGNGAVVSAGGYQSLPDTLFGTETESVTTATGKAYRRLETLNLGTSFQEPSVEITKRNGDTVVQVEGRQSTVRSGEELTVTLDARDVEAKVLKILDETVDRPDIPDYRKAKKQVERVETTTVVPTLKVRSYGELEVVDATDQHFVPDAH